MCKKDNTIKSDIDEIKDLLNKNISFYMRPKKIIEIDKFIMNNSNKVDRKALKEIAKQELENIHKDIVKPTSSIEKDIYNIIKSHENIEEFSITDDFIDDLVLDSLDMTMLSVKLQKYNIEIQDLYNFSNIKLLAKSIEEGTEKRSSKICREDIVINNIKSEKFILDNILLTGVTGFLGTHILYELLYSKNINKIYCLIRKKDNVNGYDRLQKTINYYFRHDIKIQELVEQKVVVLDGEITEKLFGLEQDQYNYLRKTVTTVINSMANVRHYGKYDMFYKDNILSVKNLLEFCKNKISLAQMSTLSIAGFKSKETKDIFTERKLYINQDLNENPYLISKFEGEKILLTQNDTNVKIFRLGNIMPRRHDGIFQINYTQNAFLNAMKILYKTKTVPDIKLDARIEFSAVDECSKSIIKILNSNDSNNVYHIVNNNMLDLDDICNIFKRDLGIEVLKISLNEFINNIKSYEEIGVQYLKDYVLENKLNNYSCKNTVNLLKELNFSWSKIDGKYLKHLIAVIKKS